MIGQPAKKSLPVVTISGSDCPFLYQTRTILRQYHASRYRSITTSSSPSSSTDRKLISRNQAQGDEPELERSSFLKQKAAQVTSNKRKPASSITPAEQAAFDNIWALFEKPSPSTPQARATSANHADTDYKNILELFSKSPFQTSDTVNQPKKNGLVADESDLDETVADDPAELNQVTQQDVSTNNRSAMATQRSSGGQPKLSRASAMREIKGFLKETATLSTYTTPTTDTTQAITLRIVEDVADSLTTALASKSPRPDIAMWRVAEEKIFPLVRLLRPSTPNLSSPLPSEQQPKSDALSTDGQLHPLIPPYTPLLPLLSQTYPALTLLILRLYTAHHPTSPYALALLPTLKSLGPTSYVLGAHTHFYNALLSLHWRMYSDLRGMNSLLGEMDANGVEFDVGTWEVLRMVGEDRERDLPSDDTAANDTVEGGRGAAWWDRLEQRVWWPRVGVQWKDVVRRRLGEKGVLVEEDNAVFREGPAGIEEKPEYMVTL